LRTMKTKAKTLNPELLRKIDAYWRVANHLSVGQIYLYDNPLLRKPLKLVHIKPPARSLGHDAGTELHLRPTETACGPVGASSNDTAASAHVLDCPVVDWSQRTQRLFMMNHTGEWLGRAHVSGRRV
jgi:hypothetical protein